MHFYLSQVFGFEFWIHFVEEKNEEKREENKQIDDTIFLTFKNKDSFTSERPIDSIR